jgi:hypothetical protein
VTGVQTCALPISLLCHVSVFLLQENLATLRNSAVHG